MRRFLHPIGSFFAVAIATPALATTLTSGLLLADGTGGERLMCTVVNAGTKPLTAVSVRLFDYSGTEIPSATDVAGPLLPGQTYGAQQVGFGGYGYCTVTFDGSKKSARASLSRQGPGTGVGIASLTSIPVQ